MTGFIHPLLRLYDPFSDKMGLDNIRDQTLWLEGTRWRWISFRLEMGTGHQQLDTRITANLLSHS